MKKILALILAAALALSLVACGGGADTPTASPDEIPTEEVTAPQETEEQEEPTETTGEEPTEEASEPVETEPVPEGNTKKSALYDESGNLVSMDEFIHEYQYILTVSSYLTNRTFYTVEMPEDSNVSYYIYTHKDANSDGVQTKTSIMFSNGGEVVGEDGVYDNIILLTTTKLTDDDALELHLLAVTELMYAIDPSNDEGTYLDWASDAIIGSEGADDGYIIESNGITYTFHCMSIGSGFYMLGMNVQIVA